MALVQFDQADTLRSPPHRSYEELQHEDILVSHSPDVKRLVWTLNGPLESSFSVMKDPRNPGVLEPYCTPCATDKDTWNVVAQSSLTTPKISSITVAVYNLEQWENSWLDDHGEHESPEALYGALSDYDSSRDGGDPEHLLMCCDEVRPRGKAVSLVVRPAVDGEGFVTVHDYVSAVHPWLMGLRGDILKAKFQMYGNTVPMKVKLVVNATALAHLKIEESRDNNQAEESELE